MSTSTPHPFDKAIALQHSLLGKVLNGLQAFTNPAQGVTTSLIFVWSSPTYRSRRAPANAPAPHSQ